MYIIPFAYFYKSVFDNTFNRNALGKFLGEPIRYFPTVNLSPIPLNKTMVEMATNKEDVINSCHYIL